MCSSHSLVCWFPPSVPAGVDVILAYGAPEEALAAVTAGGSVVFSRGLVAADGTVGTDPVWTGKTLLGRHAFWISQKGVVRVSTRKKH